MSTGFPFHLGRLPGPRAGGAKPAHVLRAGGSECGEGLRLPRPVLCAVALPHEIGRQVAPKVAILRICPRLVVKQQHWGAIAEGIVSAPGHRMFA